MAEATHADMNHTDLAYESPQQKVELQPLLSSRPTSPDMNQAAGLAFESAQQIVELPPPLSFLPTDLSSNYLQKQQHVEDEVTIDIKKRIQDCKDGQLLLDCCIYKVPITLRHLKEEAYTPKVVSIGPFHHGNEGLQDMESHKQILFKRFTQRAMSNLDDLVRFVKHLEPKVRASYSETVNLTKQELVNLTLMDAGFIIELFIMFHEVDEVRNDAKLSQPWLQVSIAYDLVLLENQLPFFVIEELFNQTFPHRRFSSLPSFRSLVYNYFRYYSGPTLEPNPDVKIKHFTDLFRLFYLQGKISQRDSEAGSHILLYNANALQEAGIKLQATTSKSLLDLKFSEHILEIPQIFVDGHTEILFRNIIALEQCHYPYEGYITDYVLVLDYLIDTYKDVDLLVDKKIVTHFSADSNNVALLFNGLGANVAQTNFNSEYRDICQKLNGYCQDPWHKLKATLRRDYCRTPWQIVASIAAAVLLVLTTVQTIVSILK